MQKFSVIVNNVPFYSTFDSAEAEEKESYYKERFPEVEVLIQIDTVSEKEAIEGLLDRIKFEKQCSEVLKSQMQSLKELNNFEILQREQAIRLKEKTLDKQAKTLIKEQKKILELQNILQIPQNRLQRELLKEREKCRELERKLNEVKK